MNTLALKHMWASKRTAPASCPKIIYDGRQELTVKARFTANALRAMNKDSVGGRDARRLHAVLSNSGLFIIPGVGHLVHYAVPEQVVSAVEPNRITVGSSVEQQDGGKFTS